MAAYKEGIVRLGVVNNYDPVTMTAEVTEFDGMTVLRNVSVLMQACDMGEGIYQYTPPTPGSHCYFTQVSGEATILGYYLPRNVNGANGNEPTTNATISRTPGELLGSESTPGSWRVTSPAGAEISLKGLLYSIRMSPIFYTTWNLLNNVLEYMVDRFKFFSPAVDVNVDVDAAQETNTTVLVRSTVAERNGTPAVDLRIGKNAGIINLKINGADFLQVDAARNVTLHSSRLLFNTGDIVINGANFNFTGNDIRFHGTSFDLNK